MKTLLFLSDFWQKAKTSVDDICTELPKVTKEDILTPVGTSGKMWTIQFKDMGNNWSVEDQLKRQRGESQNLIDLCDKVRSIFEKSPDKVADFLKATAKRGYFLNRYTGKKTILSINEVARLNLYIKENS